MQSLENIYTRQVFVGHTRPVYGAAYSPDGKSIASGSADHTVRLWTWKTGKVLRIFTGHVDNVNSVVFSPDGKYISAAARI